MLFMKKLKRTKLKIRICNNSSRLYTAEVIQLFDFIIIILKIFIFLFQRDSPIDVEDDSFNVHQALEMLGHQATSGATTPNYEPGKKRRRLGTITTTAQSLDGQTITEEIIISPEAFQCQVENKHVKSEFPLLFLVETKIILQRIITHTHTRNIELWSIFL